MSHHYDLWAMVIFSVLHQVWRLFVFRHPRDQMFSGDYCPEGEFTITHYLLYF